MTTSYASFLRKFPKKAFQTTWSLRPSQYGRGQKGGIWPSPDPKPKKDNQHESTYRGPCFNFLESIVELAGYFKVVPFGLLQVPAFPVCRFRGPQDQGSKVQYGASKKQGPLFGSPCNADRNVLGSNWGLPVLGNLHIREDPRNQRCAGSLCLPGLLGPYVRGDLRSKGRDRGTVAGTPDQETPRTS